MMSSFLPYIDEPNKIYIIGDRKIGKSNYELLDDIYMDLEMYEENIDIRNNEKYCIDEHQLLKRISEKYMKLYK